MAICLAAFIVSGFLSIFCARYRTLAKESFKCVLKLIQRKPCDTGLDQKIKSKVTAKLLKKNATLAKFTYKHFSVLSLIFVVLFLSSLFYSLYGIHNLIVYGSCNPHSSSCIFNPSTTSCGGVLCQEQCLCDEKNCEYPDYLACEGNCDCEKNICG